jgi:hypothetical protein
VTPKGQSGFVEEATTALDALRRTVSLGLQTVPARHRAADLRRSLDLDAALAWQIHTVSTGDDVLSLGRVVPKSGSMDRFLRALESAGVDERVRGEIRCAYEGFERVVEIHAGDRKTFEAMLNALRPDDGTSLQKSRREAFVANTTVWGLSVRCLVNCVIFRPRPTGEHDCLCIRGRVGVRGLRPGASMGIYASSRTWGGAYAPAEGTPDVSLDGCSLLQDACSQPLPRIETRLISDGSQRDYLLLDGLGRQREATVFWRSFTGNFPGGSSEGPQGCSTACTEPTELMLVDLMVPRGLTDPSTASVRLTGGDHMGRPLTGPDEGGDQLRFEGRVEHLGSRLEALYTPEAPLLAQTVKAELDRQGWGETLFDLYRCVVRYPVMHAMVHVWTMSNQKG